MGKLDWHKRNHDKALGGMMGLTLEERGAYNTVLDLIYSHDDRLADDDRFIAGWCQCDVRVWKRIKVSLIEKRKLYVEDGLLRNFRATSEVLQGLSIINERAAAGRAGGIKSGAVRRKNKYLREASVEATHEANSNTTTTTTTEEEPSANAEGRARKASNGRGSFIPECWLPTAEDRAYAEKLGLNADVVAEEFRGYWHERHDAKARRENWSLTWQRWCIKASGAVFRRPAGHGGGNRGGPKGVVAALRLLETTRADRERDGS